MSTAAATPSADSSRRPPDYPSYGVVPKTDFGPFSEYSVIHTDRSLNLMSSPFGTVMRDLNSLLKYTYQADQVAIIPGSGTFGMESVARQFARPGDNIVVLRNGWFSYRWTEILEHMGMKEDIQHTVMKAIPEGNQFRPARAEDVKKIIREQRPKIFFCPHVETSTGMILPDAYIKDIAETVHDVGGIFVLDCIASGTVWVDMRALGVDVLISAPQKGWTGPPCAGLVMMSERARDLMHNAETSATCSFSLSLKRWSAIMDAYTGGGFGYHTTMPTDALREFHEVTVETLDIGLDVLKANQLELGKRAREILDSKGLVSVAAPGYQAPGVLVYFSPANTPNPAMMKAFHDQGLQIAMGVPWKIDEPAGLKTFRIGLFGLDKLMHIDQTLATMERALDNVLEECGRNEGPTEMVSRL